MLPTQSSRVKRSGPDVDHSPPPNCEVKWRYVAAAPVCLPGVGSQNLILPFPLVLHVTPSTDQCAVHSLQYCSISLLVGAEFELLNTIRLRFA